MDKETKKEFESLARMVKKGFDDVTLQITGVNVHVENLKTDQDKRFDNVEKKIDQAWTLIDGYVKAQEDFREEFKIMKYKMTQMEKIIKTKLGVVME
jgi:hypothetical protein